MTKPGGGATINRGPAPCNDPDRVGVIAGDVREKGQDPAPDEDELGETSEAGGCTAHDRAG